MIKNVLIIFRKYGFFIGIYVVFKLVCYKLSKAKSCEIINDIPGEVFTVKGLSLFSEIYKGDVKNDGERIRSGQRKTLDYEGGNEDACKDIKVTWELKRGLDLPVDALYAGLYEKATSYIFDTERMSHVFERTCAMEVAICAINYVEACKILNTYEITYNRHDTANFLKNCCQYILQHLEKQIVFSNNHYFFNLLGLLWVLESCTEDQILNKLKNSVYDELKEFLNTALLKDGALYEGSTHYHKYITESLILFMFLNEKAEKHNFLIDAAKRMNCFCRYASFENRLIGIGDNDSGRVLPLPEYFIYDSRDCSFVWNIAKRLNLEPVENEIQSNIALLQSSDTPSFGLFKPENDLWQVSVRCDALADGFLKKFMGTHFHNDQLSITAKYKGKEIIVDTGVYSYISEGKARLDNMKTSSHSTLSVEGEEQNEISNDWNYEERKAVGKVHFYEPKVFMGRHDGYKNALHVRSVKVEDSLYVKDSLILKKHTKGKQVKIYYHIHPDIQVEVKDYGVIFLYCGDFTLYMHTKAQVNLVASRYCPEYGMRIPATAVVLTINSGYGKKGEDCINGLGEVRIFELERNDDFNTAKE